MEIAVNDRRHACITCGRRSLIAQTFRHRRSTLHCVRSSIASVDVVIVIVGRIVVLQSSDDLNWLLLFAPQDWYVTICMLIWLLIDMTSADRRPCAPLAGMLNGLPTQQIKDLMHQVMPILTIPKMRKEELIASLIDFLVGSPHRIADTCKATVKDIQKPYLSMLIRDIDPRTPRKLSKSGLIDHFISLNTPPASAPKVDEPCTAIVLYDKNNLARECGQGSHDGQMVDIGKHGNKLIKTRKRLIKMWMKGGRLMRRKAVSKAMIREMRHCLSRGKWKNWTVTSLKDHVASVVGVRLDTGHALIFFHKKLQQYLPRKPKSKKINGPVTHAHYSVPKAGCLFIADADQWREIRAMFREDKPFL